MSQPRAFALPGAGVGSDLRGQPRDRGPAVAQLRGSPSQIVLRALGIGITDLLYGDAISQCRCQAEGRRAAF
jgi:hypothetical protein